MLGFGEVSPSGRDLVKTFRRIPVLPGALVICALAVGATVFVGVAAAAQSVPNVCSGSGASVPPAIGGVLAWGRADLGQLGAGPTSTTYADSPATVSGLSTAAGVVAVSAGHDYSLALKSDGTILAWGDDSYGQLGDAASNLPGTARTVTTPVTVAGLGAGSGVIAISAGYQFALALKKDGSVWTWGATGVGDNGLTTIVSHVPVQVTNLGPGSGVTSIAAGNMGGLALKGDGSVVEWGSMPGGDPHGGSPSGVVGLGSGGGVIAIAVGQLAGLDVDPEHALALKADGSVWAWGQPAQGEAGSGDPEMVSSLGPGSGVFAVAAGGGQDLALESDGTVLAWGDGSRGQLGTGSQEPNGSANPVPVSGLGAGSGVTAIAAGEFSSFALKSDGTALAWGANLQGELGTGSSGDLQAPAPVAGLAASGTSVAGVQEIAGGGDHALAVQSGLFEVCSGSNSQAFVGGAKSLLGGSNMVGFSPPVEVVLRDSTNHAIPNATVAFSAPSNGPSTSATSGTSKTGRDGTAFLPIAMATANDQAGSYVVTAQVTVGSPPGATLQVSIPLTNLADLDTSVTPSQGTPQNAAVGQRFAATLAVKVQDQFGNVVPGVPVTFTAPTTGASGTFPQGSTASVTTDASGAATAPELTANSVQGTFTVTASTPSIQPGASFSLTNVSGPVTDIETVAGTPQTANEGAVFPTALQAKVLDAQGNPMFNVAVTFTAPTAGPSGTFSLGGQLATGAMAFTNAQGIAAAPPFSANGSAGPYIVVARAAGFDPAAVFSLTNAATAGAGAAAGTSSNGVNATAGSQTATSSTGAQAGASSNAVRTAASASSSGPSTLASLAQTGLGFGMLLSLACGLLALGLATVASSVRRLRRRN